MSTIEIIRLLAAASISSLMTYTAQALKYAQRQALFNDRVSHRLKAIDDRLSHIEKRSDLRRTTDAP